MAFFLNYLLEYFQNMHSKPIPKGGVILDTKLTQNSFFSIETSFDFGL